MPDNVQSAYTWSNLVLICAQSCPPLCNHMACTLPGSSVHGILQAGVLEWVAIPFSRRSSQPRDWTRVSWIACRNSLPSEPPRTFYGQRSLAGYSPWSHTRIWHNRGRNPYSSPCCQGFCLAKRNFRLSMTCLFTSSPPYLGSVSLPLCFPQHSGWIVFMLPQITAGTSCFYDYAEIKTLFSSSAWLAPTSES